MLTLYEPKYEDLWFRQMMLADEDTMSYNHAWGGTIPFGEDKWRGWYDCWIADPDGKRYYRYLKNEDGQFVGEIAYHYDAEMQQEIANVMIYAKYRRRGYGGEALDLLCSAAKSNGVSVLYDDIAIDNPAVSLFLKHGFVEESRTEEIILLKRNCNWVCPSSRSIQKSLAACDAPARLFCFWGDFPLISPYVPLST